MPITARQKLGNEARLRGLPAVNPTATRPLRLGESSTEPGARRRGLIRWRRIADKGFPVITERSVAMSNRRREVRFEEMFPWEIAAAMAEAPLCYLPLGTLEWHGEHAAVGLDALKAHAICVRAAQRSGGLVVPPLYWSTDWREDLPDGSYLTGGIERGERYHVPGNMFWLRPETFHNLLLDIYEAMRRRGFRAIVVLSGHWSIAHNIAAIWRTGEE